MAVPENLPSLGGAHYTTKKSNDKQYFHVLRENILELVRRIRLEFTVEVCCPPSPQSPRPAGRSGIGGGFPLVSKTAL
jgi:hypothetical protein